MPKVYKSSFTPNGEEEPPSKTCLECKELLPIKKFKSSRNQKRSINGIDLLGTVRNAKCLACETTKLPEEEGMKLSEIEEFEKALRSVYNHFTSEIETLTRKVNDLERIISEKKGSELPSWVTRDRGDRD